MLCPLDRWAHHSIPLTKVCRTPTMPETTVRLRNVDTGSALKEATLLGEGHQKEIILGPA